MLCLKVGEEDAHKLFIFFLGWSFKELPPLFVPVKWWRFRCFYDGRMAPISFYLLRKISVDLIASMFVWKWKN